MYMTLILGLLPERDLRVGHVNGALRNKVHKMLTRPNGWSGFSNKMFNKDEGTSTSSLKGDNA
jgi:hypothetical protein